MTADLGALKELHRDLSKALLRIIVIRLTVLLAVVLTFSHAFQRLDMPETRKTIEALYACGPQDWMESLRKEVDDPFLLPLFHAGVRAYVVSRSDVNEVREGNAALACLGQFEAVYRSVFQFKIGLWGFDVSIDLRPWFFVLAPLLIVSELFVALARRKRDLIERLLAHTLSSGKPDGEALLADRIAIGLSPLNPSPFSKYPGRLIEAGASALAAVLAASLIAMSAATWQMIPGFLILQFVAVCAMFVFHAVALGVWMGESLRRHVTASGGWAIEASRPYRSWTRAKERWGRFYKRMPPRASLVSGALLVAASLVLSMTVSCNKKSAGLRLLTSNPLILHERGTARWITTQDIHLISTGSWDDPDTTVGSIVLDSLACAPYVLSLGLALAALVLAAGLRERWRLRVPQAPLWFLSSASCFASLFAVADTTLLGPGDKDGVLASPSLWWIVCPWLTFWLVPFAVRSGFRRTGNPAAAVRWSSIREALILFLLPAAVWGAANLVYQAAARGLWGLLVWALGVHLLTLGFLRMAVWRRDGLAPALAT